MTERDGINKPVNYGASSPIKSRRAPSTIEIIGLPIAGAAAIEMLHTRHNELVLLFCPFMIVVVRLFIAQFQIPPASRRSIDPSSQRASRLCIGINQIAAFVLLVFEAAVAILTGQDVPKLFWLGVAGIFSFYVALRLVSRKYWITAAEPGA